MSKRSPIGFILSGERGVSPDLIVGTSAGALNGAYIASRPQSVETANALGEIWRGLRRGQVFSLNPVTVCSASSARATISCPPQGCTA